MFCQKCGNEVPVGYKFCAKCGMPLQQKNKASKRMFAPGACERKLNDIADNLCVDEFRSFFVNLFSFSGRSTRFDWWLMYIMISTAWIGLVVFIILSASGSIQFHIEFQHAIFWIVGSFIVEQFLLLSTNVRRFHDSNHSGWLLFLFWMLSFVPLINIVAWIIKIYMLGFMDGTFGTNNYGDDPKDRKGIIAKQIDERSFD